MSRGSCCLAACAALLLAVGCASPTYRVHYTLLDAPARALPSQAILLPADVRMFEISAGGVVVEEVPEWSQQATANARAAVDSVLSWRRQNGKASLEILPLPALSPGEEELVSEHLALYESVAQSGLFFSRMPGDAWAHKVRHFDYSLGDGLGFLAERSGADVAIVVVGSNSLPSEGRVAMAVFGAMLGVQMVNATAQLHIGLVDLRTGDLLWVNDAAIVSQGLAAPSFRDPGGVESMIRSVVEPYPGLEDYDAFRRE